MDATDLERVAYHEAGHVVIDWLYDLPIEAVEIHEGGGQVLNVDGIVRPWDQATACYAGLAAECIRYDLDPGNILAGHAVGDILNAQEAIESMVDEIPGLDDWEREDHVDRMTEAIFQGAIDELKAHWWAVQSLALALVARGRLTSDEVLEVIDEGQLEAIHPESAAVLDRYAGLLDDLLESRFESTGQSS